jgi:hypothetical protein
VELGEDTGGVNSSWLPSLLKILVFQPLSPVSEFANSIELALFTNFFERNQPGVKR